jgi:hypothetical protein
VGQCACLISIRTLRLADGVHWLVVADTFGHDISAIEARGDTLAATIPSRTS